MDIRTVCEEELIQNRQFFLFYILREPEGVQLIKSLEKDLIVYWSWMMATRWKKNIFDVSAGQLLD